MRVGTASWPWRRNSPTIPAETWTQDFQSWVRHSNHWSIPTAPEVKEWQEKFCCDIVKTKETRRIVFTSTMPACNSPPRTTKCHRTLTLACSESLLEPSMGRFQPVTSLWCCRWTAMLQSHIAVYIHKVGQGSVNHFSSLRTHSHTHSHMSVHTCTHTHACRHNNTHTQKLVHRYLYNNSIHPKNVDISVREREESERETITEKKMQTVTCKKSYKVFLVFFNCVRREASVRKYFLFSLVSFSLQCLTYMLFFHQTTHFKWSPPVHMVPTDIFCKKQY